MDIDIIKCNFEYSNTDQLRILDTRNPIRTDKKLKTFSDRIEFKYDQKISVPFILLNVSASEGAPGLMAGAAAARHHGASKGAAGLRAGAAAARHQRGRPPVEAAHAGDHPGGELGAQRGADASQWSRPTKPGRWQRLSLS